MYNCYTHGWSHPHNPCTSCFRITSSDTSKPCITEVVKNIAPSSTEFRQEVYNVQLLAEHYEFLLNAAEDLYKPNDPITPGLSPPFYYTLSYEGDLELIEKTKQARKAYEKWLNQPTSKQ